VPEVGAMRLDEPEHSATERRSIIMKSIGHSGGNPAILKLNQAGTLEERDLSKLSAITCTSYLIDGKRDIIQQGEPPKDVHLMMSGLACRYKMLPDGSRSIMALLVPGDFCDLHVAILGHMDHGIGTLAPSRVVDIPREIIDDLTSNEPRITRTLWWATLVDEAILREWLVSMGRRRAMERVAHLLCELEVRLKTVHLSEGGSFELPINQETLADMLGMSLVHVNRMLQKLSKDRLISISGKTVTIHDRAALWDFAGFDPGYLHLSRHSLAALVDVGCVAEASA